MLMMTNLLAGLSSSGKVLITVVEQTLFNPSDFKKLKEGTKEPAELLFIRTARF